MHRAGHQPGKTRALLALLACALMVSGTLACDRDGSPFESTVASPDILRDAAAPARATIAEQALLAAPAEVDTPPRFDELAPSNSAALLAATQCTIGFADYIGLLILPDQAGHTFASSPYYIQGCGSGWVHVKENDPARYGSSWGSSYNHYHLMYEKGPYCIPNNGSYGYQSGGSCIAVPTPANEPRYLASHYGNQWIRIYVYKSGVPEMTFDFKSIRVKGAQGIKLWFRKADGSWWNWSNLGTGTWNVAPYAAGIREILIRASNNSSQSYSFDTVIVGVN